MKEYRIQADAKKELAVTRWPDGRYSIKVFSSLGQQAAHLIIPRDEGEKLTDALNNLRHEFDMRPIVQGAECDECGRHDEGIPYCGESWCPFKQKRANLVNAIVHELRS